MRNAPDPYIQLKNRSDKAKALDVVPFIAMLEAAYELRKAVQDGGDDVDVQLIISKYKPMLMTLMEYLALNIDNPNIDPEILRFLEKIMGKRLAKKKEKGEKEEEGKDDELSEEEKKHRIRMVMYEIYKFTNPNQLAGESSIINFISNVKARGAVIARKYDGKEHASSFTLKEIKNMESYQGLIRQTINDSGHRGAGL